VVELDIIGGFESCDFRLPIDGILNGMESGFQCASCGEWNVTSVDESAGRRQSYVEDCQVCCKPNVLRIEYDLSAQEFFISTELE
jgi:hypothetical protein